MSICGLHYRDAALAVEVVVGGSDLRVFVNDVERQKAFVPADAAGSQHVKIELPETGEDDSRA